MHISDGILPPEVWVPSYIIAGAGVGYILANKTEVSDIPKLSLITSAVFVASLIHVKVGPTSVHFILSGLAGIALGWAALPSICVALILQAFLFQHGGITTIGVNTLIMGLPALAAYGIFSIGTRLDFKWKYALFGGLGVKATIQGQEVLLGSAETLAGLGLAVPADVELEGRATWVGVDGQVVGAIFIQDVLREYAAGLADELRALGIEKVVLATGDSEESEARRVAEIIGADEVHWGSRPEDKTAIVRELQAEGITVMVGDGVNDATSLAVADVGIAIGGAKADLAIKSSDVIVLREDATNLLTVMRMGKKLRRVIKQNYTWAILFNLIGIGLATLGALNPPLAALLHHVSSVFVVSNSARLIRK